MSDELDELRRLFSKKDADEEKPSEDEPDGEESSGESLKGKALDEIWGIKSRAEEEEEEDKPILGDGDDTGDIPETDSTDTKEPFIPSKAERPGTKSTFKVMALDHLRQQTQKPEPEKPTEPEPEDEQQEEADTPPAWADGVSEDEVTEERLQSIRDTFSSDDSPEIPPEEEPPLPDDTPEAVDFRSEIPDEPVSELPEEEPEPEKEPEDDIEPEGEEPSTEPAPSFSRYGSLSDSGDADSEGPKVADEGEIEAVAEEVDQLRDALLRGSPYDEPERPKRKRPVYHEPTVDFKPLVSFVGLVGAICLGIALLMSLMGAKAGLSLMGLSGVGSVMIIIYGIANRENLKIVLSARSTRYGTNVSIVILCLLAILVVMNSIGYKHYLVYDMTAEKLYSLSDQTLQVLERLDSTGRDVDATVFVPKERDFTKYRDILEDTLEKYRYHLATLNIEWFDPDVSRQRAEELEFSDRVGVVFETGDKRERAVEFTPDSPISFEYALTGALLRLTGTHVKRVYFLSGHNELIRDDFTKQNRRSAGFLAQALEIAGYQVEGLSFATRAEVPVDCSMLIIAGPERELMPVEIAAVKSYIESGGRVLLMLESRNDAGFGPFLEQYGIHFRSDLIADNLNNLLNSNSLCPVLDLNEHAITAPLKRNGMDVVFFKASGLDVDPNPPQGQFLERLLSTKAGGGSWSESGKGEAVVMDPEEDRGPFTMAVMVEKEISLQTPAGESESPEEESGRIKWGRMFVTGDASFIANLNLGTYGNKDFILNTINYMTGDELDLSIRPPEMRPLMVLKRGQASIVFFVSIVLIPLLVAAFGVTVWLRRK